MTGIEPTYQSVSDYIAAKKAGDGLAATGIVWEAIARFEQNAITADEYNALMVATMTTRSGEGL